MCVCVCVCDTSPLDNLKIHLYLALSYITIFLLLMNMLVFYQNWAMICDFLCLVQYLQKYISRMKL